MPLTDKQILALRPTEGRVSIESVGRRWATALGDAIGRKVLEFRLSICRQAAETGDRPLPGRFL